MPKVEKVLMDYEEVLWRDQKHASWFETLSWFVHDEIRKDEKKRKMEKSKGCSISYERPADDTSHKIPDERHAEPL